MRVSIVKSDSTSYKKNMGGANKYEKRNDVSEILLKDLYYICN